MKKFTISLILLLSNAVVFAAPYREATELEKRLAAAKKECYRNYDKLEAHFKFAGVLYDCGCLESAFANTETLLKNAASDKVIQYFNDHTRRKLKPLLPADTPPPPQKSTPQQQHNYFQGIIRRNALSDPDAATYLRFAADSEKWNSKDKADISLIREKILNSASDRKLAGLLEYNLAAANYLYLAAKDYESALPFFIRLYFHEPDIMTALAAPAGFTINAMLQRITPMRRNRMEILSRRDPVKLILSEMHTHPRTVENFLMVNKSSMDREKFVKLCLLASDSVDLRLRSFAFGELMKRDVSCLLPLLHQLLRDQDSGRRAVAALLLPHTLSPVELPEALAELAKDPDAVVRMSAEAVAKARCDAGNYARFRELTDKK